MSVDRKVFTVTAVCFGMTALALVGFTVIDVGGQRLNRAVTDGGFVVFSAVAATACLRAVRRRPSGRRLPWWLLFGTAACYTVGNLIWFYYQVLAPERQTFPGPADVFFVALVPFAVAAMATLPSRRLSTAARARAVADGLIVAASLLFISWLLVVGPLVEQLGETDWLYLAVYLYYPLTDIVIISLATGLAVRASGRERLPMLLVGVGFVAIACADTGIGYLALQGLEAAGSGLDLGWTFGYMLLALAALSPVGTDTGDEVESARAPLLDLVPYVPLLVVLIVTATNPEALRDRVLVGLLVTVVFLLVVRHLLSLTDNDRLTRHLEDMVGQRTRELEHLTRRHQSILDSAAEGIVGVDAHGRVTFANPAAAALLRRSPSELAGANFHDLALADRETGPGAEDPVTASLRDGEVRTATDTGFRADGTGFDVELTVAPMRNDGGRGGAVVMFRDVTEQRAVERMKDEFISIVSHELRTPLTSIRGSLGLVAGGASGELPPAAARMVRIALDNSERLTRLINDILDIERIESGSLPMEFAVCSSADLVQTTLVQLQPVADAAGVSLRTDVVEGRIQADRDRIIQALTNLVENAVKFSDRGDTVTVAAQRDGGQIVFRVEDHGRGIPADKFAAIFEPFQQVDASDTREKGGTGLGLAITKTIVERHGGRIRVDSDPGRGSVFRFSVPALPEAPPSVAAAPDSDGHQLRVLVCDDDPDILDVLGEVLRQRGYATTLVSRGQEAVDRAVALHPDAVLLDLRMPGMTGWEAIAELKSRPETRDIPIVVMSALGPAADPELAERTDGWVTKPVDEERVVEVLTRAVRHALGDEQPTVLVVEDDDDLGAVLATIFQRQGLRVVRAASQSEAVERFREMAPDAVVLDIYLPEGDGYGVVDELQRSDHQPVPVIVYTAHELDVASRERLRLGEMAFLNKGHDSPDDLAARVVDVVHRLAERPRPVDHARSEGP